MKKLCIFLIISVLYVCLYGCKSKLYSTKKNKLERKDNTDDVRDEQMLDYEQEMLQQNNPD